MIINFYAKRTPDQVSTFALFRSVIAIATVYNEVHVGVRSDEKRKHYFFSSFLFLIFINQSSDGRFVSNSITQKLK